MPSSPSSAGAATVREVSRSARYELRWSSSKTRCQPPAPRLCCLLGTHAVQELCRRRSASRQIPVRRGRGEVAGRQPVGAGPDVGYRRRLVFRELTFGERPIAAGGEAASFRNSRRAARIRSGSTCSRLCGGTKRAGKAWSLTVCCRMSMTPGHGSFTRAIAPTTTRNAGKIRRARRQTSTSPGRTCPRRSAMPTG